MSIIIMILMSFVVSCYGWFYELFLMVLLDFLGGWRIWILQNQYVYYSSFAWSFYYLSITIAISSSIAVSFVTPDVLIANVVNFIISVFHLILDIMWIYHLLDQYHFQYHFPYSFQNYTKGPIKNTKARISFSYSFIT